MSKMCFNMLVLQNMFPSVVFIVKWFLSFYFKAYGCLSDGWCSPATWSVKLHGWRSNL